MNPELQKYVSQARGSGRSDMQITQDLRSNGWNENDISFALGTNSVSNPIPKPPVVPSRLMRKEVLAGLVFIVLLGGGIYFASSKGGLMGSTPKVQYVDANGILSFDHPSNWITPVEKSDALAVFYISDGESKDSIISPDGTYGINPSYGTFVVLAEDDVNLAKNYSEEALRDNGITLIKKETVLVDSIQSNKLVLKGNAYGNDSRVSTTMIIIPFSADKINIVIYYSGKSQEVLEQIEKVIESIKIDQPKLSTSVDGLNAIQKEASMKALLYGMRPSAEIYYDSHKNSYAGVCSDTVNDLTKPLRDLRSKFDPNIKCTSVANSYAISLLSPKKEYWCVDSTGFVGITSNYHSGTACK